MRKRSTRPNLWRDTMLFVTGAVLVVSLFISTTYMVYINDVLRKNAQSSFLDLSDKLAQSIAALLSETELLGQAIARDTVLQGAMQRADSQYPLLTQYDDFFRLKALLAQNQDHKQISQIHLVFFHTAFYTREGVSLLSIRSDAARQLGLRDTGLHEDTLGWQAEENALRYVQPVLNVTYATNPIGLVVLELSESRMQGIFDDIQSLADARYELLLGGESVRVYGDPTQEAGSALHRTVALSGDWTFVLSASDLRYALRLSQSVLATLPIVLAGCVIVLAAGRFFARRSYQGIASLAQAISTVDILGDQQIRPARYQELDVIVTHFNAMLGQIRKKFKEEIQTRETERSLALRMLESQINPHFLHNSLDAINWLAYQQGAEDVASMARALGSFYRDALSKTTNEALLADELSHVRTYLDIMRCRVEGEIGLRIHIAQEHLSASIPRLSLQPIVENAVQHGILRTPDQQGTIDVYTSAEADCLSIHVLDNGPGMPEDKLEAFLSTLAIWPPEEMHGLVNIHHRTLLLYGPPYGLHVQSEAGAYMLVTLRVPYRHNVSPSGNTPAH